MMLENAGSEPAAKLPSQLLLDIREPGPSHWGRGGALGSETRRLGLLTPVLLPTDELLKSFDLPSCRGGYFLLKVTL